PNLLDVRVPSNCSRARTCSISLLAMLANVLESTLPCWKLARAGTFPAAPTFELLRNILPWIFRASARVFLLPSTRGLRLLLRDTVVPPLPLFRCLDLSSRCLRLRRLRRVEY